MGLKTELRVNKRPELLFDFLSPRSQIMLQIILELVRFEDPVITQRTVPSFF